MANQRTPIQTHENKGAEAPTSNATAQLPADIAQAMAAADKRVADLEAQLKSGLAQFEALSANAQKLDENHTKLKSAFESLKKQYETVCSERDQYKTRLAEERSKGGGGGRPWERFVVAPPTEPKS